MPNISDIYSVRIFYKGQTGQSKIRPVLILNNIGDIVTIAEITTAEPKNPPTYYDSFKEEIKCWRECGLEKNHILNVKTSIM